MNLTITPHTRPISTTLPTEDGPYWWFDGERDWRIVNIVTGSCFDCDNGIFISQDMKPESWPIVGQWIKIERP